MCTGPNARCYGLLPMIKRLTPYQPVGQSLRLAFMWAGTVPEARGRGFILSSAERSVMPKHVASHTWDYIP